MIEQDLLGISVSDLLDNYCVIYNKITETIIGITTIKNAEKIEEIYGIGYEKEYVFLDIFAADQEIIKQNKILTYYEVQKILEKYIGWTPSPEQVNYMAACVHEQWVDITKESTQLLLDLLRIITSNQELINDADVLIIAAVKEQIDKWRKSWCSYWSLDDKNKEKNIETAIQILKKMKEEGEKNE